MLLLCITAISSEVAYTKILIYQKLKNINGTQNGLTQGHTSLVSFLSLMRFLNLSRQCSQNDTIYLHFIKEFDKVPQDGDIQVKFQYSIEIIDFSSTGGKFLFLILSFFIFLPMTLKKIQKVYSSRLWITESITKRSLLSGGQI